MPRVPQKTLAEDVHSLYGKRLAATTVAGIRAYGAILLLRISKRVLMWAFHLKILPLPKEYQRVAGLKQPSPLQKGFQLYNKYAVHFSGTDIVANKFERMEASKTLYITAIEDSCFSGGGWHASLTENGFVSPESKRGC